MRLTDEGKELVILLWRDFKSQKRFNPDIIKQSIMFTKILNIEKEYCSILTKLPPMQIIPR